MTKIIFVFILIIIAFFIGSCNNFVERKDKQYQKEPFKDVSRIKVYKELKVMVLNTPTADNKIDLDEVSSFEILED